MKLLSTLVGYVLWPFKQALRLVKYVACKLFGFWCPKKEEEVPEKPNKDEPKVKAEAKKNVGRVAKEDVKKKAKKGKRVKKGK